MYKINFEKPIHIHFIGIGGISMSGLAEILLKEGFTVSGSDNKASALTEQLEQNGAKIYIGQRASNITDDIDLVVYTAAIHPDNAEWKAASDAGIPMLTRAQFLGQLMDNYAKSIAVSGTHGKTTTTSMISHILLAADSDPTISVGGMLEAIGGNIRVGGSDVFLTEACEYTNSFLNFHPKYSIILNIEEDHMDFFKDINDIRNSFHKFAQNTAADGILFLNAAIDHPEEITADLKERIVTFGLTEDADYTATDITYNEEACASFTFNVRGQAAGHVSLNVPGKHNIANALAAIAVAYDQGLTLDDIRCGLLTYEGLAMRQQIHELDKITVIDDSYNASPDSIKSGIGVLMAVKSTGKKIAVLADMLELGERSAQAHLELGAYAAASGVDAVVTVGREAEKIAEGAAEESRKILVKACGTNDEAFAELEKILNDGDCVLVKGSRGMHTDEIVQKLLTKYQ